MITISKEDYLKAIAEAEAEGQTVIPATLAHWLSVAMGRYLHFSFSFRQQGGTSSVLPQGLALASSFQTDELQAAEI